MTENAGFNAEQNSLYTALHAVLSQDSNIDDEWAIRDRTESLRPALGPNLTEDEVESVNRRLISALGIRLDRGIAITDAGHEPWLEDARTEIDWRRWRAYKQLLLRREWPPRVIDVMDQVSDEILDQLGDPRIPGVWKRRGLVIGDVQSGKTASYIAIIDKAIDAGFRLVIVLAGSTESLRQQTQERLDEGVIGRSTRTGTQTGTATNAGPFGIGAMDMELPMVQAMTTALKDFTKLVNERTNIHIGQSRDGDTYLVVLKKNGYVLEAVHKWLDQQRIGDAKLATPLLILDDESDYASVNTNAADKDNPTAINGKIRDILGLFDRSSYLAFTATPFANIFIDSDDEDDLFPRDFVYALDAPSNYVGADRTFGTPEDSRNSAIRSPGDADLIFPTKHKKTLGVNSLPRSLQQAIETFLIANAIRDIRGDDRPRAMLINVSRFKDVQAQIDSLVSDYLAVLRNSLQFHSLSFAEGEPNEYISRIKTTFDEIYSDPSGGPSESWDDVLAALRSSVAGIAVETFNSDRDKKLDEKNLAWDKPKRLIAIGGDVLSRGLTLDGLTVSYFYRRAAAFDTLMQMARWFGYRDGYEDLCRIWIEDVVAAQYRFIDEAVRELRDDLKYMRAQRLTPSDFGLAVKKHPDSLLVTARNKMRSAGDHTKVVSLVGRRIESVRLSASEASIESNFAAFRGLISSLGPRSDSDDRRNESQWSEVDRSIIATFLREFQGAPSDPYWSGSNLADFVSSSRSNLLSKWDLAVLAGSGEITWQETELKDLQSSIPVRTVLYSKLGDSDGELFMGARSSRLAGKADIARFLTRDEAKAAEDEYRISHLVEEDKSIGEAAYYPALKRPVLLLYPVEVRLSESEPAPEIEERLREFHSRGIPLIAAKLAIPGERAKSGAEGEVEYKINKVAKRLWFPEFDSYEDFDGYDE